MSEPIAMTHKAEVVPTGQRRVACDGPQFSKHPRVFLTMVDDRQGQPVDVVCPYCSRVFLYQAGMGGSAAAH